MSHFDFLNAQGNEPDPDMSYIYKFHLIWKKDVPLESYPIKYGTVVYNVKSVGNNCGYEFNLADDDTVYKCNYSWAFAENTPENIKRLKAYLAKRNELDKLTKECNKLLENIVTLEIKEKIDNV